MSQLNSGSSEPGSRPDTETERDLRLRLEEAEETLRAIREGQVDAVVVAGPQGDQVFTLRGADQPYRVILQTMHEGAVTLARNGTVLYCNEHLAEMLGMPMEQITGRSVLDLVVPEDNGLMTLLLHQAEDRKLRQELRLRAATGVVVPVVISTCPLISDGVQAISAVVTDLTERKQAERALQAAHDDLERRVAARTQELTAANAQLATEIMERIEIEAALRQSEEDLQRYGQELEAIVAERTMQVRRLEQQRMESEKQVAVGRMAARIAHEINNPLAGVKNSFRLLKGSIPTDHPHYDFVGRIDREIDRIARIVRQMYEIYKPERKEPSSCRPAKVIDDVVALLQGNSRAQNVTVELNVGAATQAVLVHEDSLRQVLFNIIQNAIEASPEGGRVTISAEQLRHQLVVAVADEGPGIPEEHRHKIFEPFYSTKEGLATGGLGLGLAITQGVVQAMGGAIDFRSEANRGTTFTVTLPVQPQPVSATA